MSNKDQNHHKHDHQHHDHDDGKIMTIEEYNRTNLMLFNIKELKTTDTAVCTLTSIDRFTFLANGIEHHECEVSLLADDYYKELVKRNLIAHFFEKIEIEPFDALDANIDVDFLFE